METNSTTGHILAGELMIEKAISTQYFNPKIKENFDFFKQNCLHIIMDWIRNGVAQPDDREHRQGGDEEACMAVLNNFYGDGSNIFLLLFAIPTI